MTSWSSMLVPVLSSPTWWHKMAEQRYFAYRAMTYNHKKVDAGELLDVGSHPNTQKMFDLGGYIGEVTNDHPCPPCARCGSVFIMEHYLEAHQRTCEAAEVDLTTKDVATKVVAEAVGA